MMGLYGQVDFRFHVNYHSFGELLLYTFGFQVKHAVGRRPDLRGPVRHRREAGDRRLQPRRGRRPVHHERGDHGLRARPGRRAGVDPELETGRTTTASCSPTRKARSRPSSPRTCPSPCRSPSRPRIPTIPCRTRIETEPFYLNVADIDPQKSWNPMSDFRFAHSYNGASQPVQVLASDIDRDGADDPVTAHFSINGGEPVSVPTEEWGGGGRYGSPTSTTTSSRARSAGQRPATPWTCGSRVGERPATRSASRWRAAPPGRAGGGGRGLHRHLQRARLPRNGRAVPALLLHWTP